MMAYALLQQVAMDSSVNVNPVFLDQFATIVSSAASQEPAVKEFAVTREVQCLHASVHLALTVNAVNLVS